MSLDEIFDGIKEFFSYSHFLDLLSSAFDIVYDYFISFLLNCITDILIKIRSTGELILTTFFNFFSSCDISDFPLIFVGFVFSFFVIKLTIHFIRG